MKKILLLFLAAALLAITNLHAQQKNKYIKIETAQGYCIVKLFNETPVHRDNFIKLAKSHYFDATTFNRILKGFVIQGGDPDSLYDKGRTLKPQQKWIDTEFNDSLYHKRGMVAMGRDGNAAKQSFTTQFYIVDGQTYTDAQLDAVEQKNKVHYSLAQRQAYKTIGGIPRLDQNYTVFGVIVKGIDLIDKITAVSVNKDGNPDKEVWMKVTVLTESEVRKEMR